jgi:hypothetical protein
MIEEIDELLSQYAAHNTAYVVMSRLRAYYYVFDNHSAYAEVRESVSNTDDPSLPVETLRAWFLGIFFCVVLASVNQVDMPRDFGELILVLFAQISPYSS